MSSGSRIYLDLWRELSGDLLSYGLSLHIYVLFSLAANHQWPIFTIPSCMVILRRSIWNNLSDMLLRERIWCVRLRRRYIILSNVHKPDLISFSCIISEVGFRSAILIIRSSFAILFLVLWLLLFMLMIFYWMGVMLLVLRKLKRIWKLSLWSKTWTYQDTLLGLKLLTINRVVLNRSMLWIY